MSSFPSIRIEGGLLGSDLLDQLLAADLPGQKAADFGLEARRNLTDEIAAVFADARALWGVFRNRLARLPEEDLATTVTRDAWVIPVLGLLGYEPRFNPRSHEVDGLTFAISHRMGEAEDAPPLHIVGARQELGRVPVSGRPRLAPHSLVQEYLNRTEHLWGLVTNGFTLRLLRDCTFVRRQAYVEFDLTGIFEEQRFHDFAALYRLLHRTRLPRGIADGDDCLLENYYARSVEQGGRVREHLRDGVEQCIRLLADGFLRHRANDELRRRVAPGHQENDRISPEDLYRQLLRLVYRFLFLLVSEDRGLLSPDPIYREHYGIARLRRLLDSRAAYSEHDDLQYGLRVLWKVLGDDKFSGFLRLPALNGALFAPQPLDGFSIANRDLLEAFWHLSWYRESAAAPSRRVNYAALDVEELGSVYEGLLEFHPHIVTQGNTVGFDLVLAGRERRSTGSHYTPPELVAPLIEHALVPVLAERLRAATTREQKVRAILSLKVCDIACGSGHFLLAAARRLGKELARVRTGEDEPAPERVREAIRDVVSHCIYGVDKNPLAVELCRVALWLESHAEGKPLTFLDHRIRCGDSLVGVFDLRVLESGIPDEAFKPVAGDDKTAAREAKKRNAAERGASLFQADHAVRLRRIADGIGALDELPEDTIEQVRAKADACDRIERGVDFDRLRLACDAWTAAFFQPFPNPLGGAVTTEAVRAALSGGRLSDPRLGGFVAITAQERRFFHWPLAFPEVFANGGFAVVLGNPPFVKGDSVASDYGAEYRAFLNVRFDPFIGKADLCALFFRRAYETAKDGGAIGLIATNSISQGDTRASGLAVILRNGGEIAMAQRFLKWPGVASVEVNLLAYLKRVLPPIRKLDEQVKNFISSRLDEDTEIEPARLCDNKNKAFEGDKLRVSRFAIDSVLANRLLDANREASECVLPILNGKELNDDPDQRSSSFVICFHNWTLEAAQRFPEILAIVKARARTEESDEEQAKKLEACELTRWWRFARYRTEMRDATRDLEHVIVRAITSELHMMAVMPNRFVFSHATEVFAFDDHFHFSLLQSNVHEAWVRRNASTMRTDIRYTPTDCFETFPFPQAPPAAARAEAERLGVSYHEHRRQTMLARQLGLTKTYNLFHNPDCTDADIVRLRELHAAMDRAILACYGCTDLDPGHGFHVNERGQTRYTISPDARRELLRRLLALNLELAAKDRAAVEGGGGRGPLPRTTT